MKVDKTHGLKEEYEEEEEDLSSLKIKFEIWNDNKQTEEKKFRKNNFLKKKRFRFPSKSSSTTNPNKKIDNLVSISFQMRSDLKKNAR